MSGRIVAAAKLDGFFHEAVTGALRAQSVESSDGTTQYLVGLLSDWAKAEGKAGRTLDRPVTLLFDEARNTPDIGERFERMRVIGDGLLYGMGFFGEHYEARGVAKGYLVSVGSQAYDSAAQILSAGSTADLGAIDVFGELGERFVEFLRVIEEVANGALAMGARSSEKLIKVYEKWLKTGSEQLEGALRSQGFVTNTRGTLS